MKDCSPDYFYSTQRFTPLSKELYQGTKPKNYKYLDNAKYKKFDYVEGKTSSFINGCRFINRVNVDVPIKGEIIRCPGF